MSLSVLSAAVETSAPFHAKVVEDHSVDISSDASRTHVNAYDNIRRQADYSKVCICRDKDSPESERQYWMDRFLDGKPDRSFSKKV